MSRNRPSRINVQTLRLRADFIKLSHKGMSRKDLLSALQAWAQEKNGSRNRSFSAAIHKLGLFKEWKDWLKALRVITAEKQRQRREEREGSREVFIQQREAKQQDRREARESAASRNTTVQAERAERVAAQRSARLAKKLAGQEKMAA